MSMLKQVNDEFGGIFNAERECCETAEGKYVGSGDLLRWRTQRGSCSVQGCD